MVGVAGADVGVAVAPQRGELGRPRGGDGRQRDGAAGDDQVGPVRGARQALGRLAQQVQPGARRGVRGEDARAGVLGNHDDGGARPRGLDDRLDLRAHALARGGEDGLGGIVERPRSVQDAGDPGPEAVDEHAAPARDGVAERVARLDRGPRRRAPARVGADARGHRRVGRVGGGHVAHVATGCDGEALGVGALARAGAADHEREAHAATEPRTAAWTKRCARSRWAAQWTCR